MAEEQAKQEQENDNSRLGDVIKVVLLAWAMAILTANYLGVFKQSLDPTYPASILSGTAASFGLAVGGNKKSKKEEPTIKEQTPTSKPK
ncbi:hypothetical protein [uncultured Mediterranean phage uvMED]|nr:hypothetical protein [uncultured Mediterranean phage uvMED]BAQ93331.1 hypothetical protein [uncultured Mediterranean phage uvMED]BAQ93352.1 hypothetical protein [uncultured Mediterranean phage uvMED]BAR24312.1 hypothetical protein [uncultured Mediterranean phage uvMED]BAR24615.1 hypothetical protein [uncultured Mediterranean phage uvMED]